jgi:hypothetical protein
MSKVDALARNPDYPCSRSLYNYAKRTGQLDRWRSSEDQRGRCERHFNAILRAVETGLTVSAALQSNSSFPNHNCFCAYLRKNPHQRFRLDGAIQASEAIRLQREKARKYFDEIVEAIRNGATEVEACEGIVAVHNFRGYVDRNPDARKALDEAREARENSAGARYRRRLHTYTEQNYDAVLAAIRAAKGKSIRKVFAVLPEELPGRQLIYARVRRDPTFAARFGEACRGRDTKVATTSGDLVARIEKLVPKHLDPAARDDIAADIVMAVLTGEIDQSDIAKSVKEYTKRFNKKFSSWEFASLDKPLGDDSDTTLGDMATSNSEMW